MATGYSSIDPGLDSKPLEEQIAEVKVLGMDDVVARVVVECWTQVLVANLLKDRTLDETITKSNLVHLYQVGLLLYCNWLVIDPCGKSRKQRIPVYPTDDVFVVFQEVLDCLSWYNHVRVQEEDVCDIRHTQHYVDESFSSLCNSIIP